MRFFWLADNTLSRQCRLVKSQDRQKVGFIVRVSVPIPTFNRPEYLERALKSVLAQTHTEWEALVIDDGDGRGLEAALAMSDPRIKPGRNGGKGQVDARNTALRRATGDVIALLDDDDLWEDSDHLALVVSVLQNGPALVHRHSFMVYEEDGREVSREAFDLPTTASSLRENNTVVASSLSYPRRLHDKLGLFDTGVGSYWDWDWILRVLDAGYPLHTVPTPGVRYTVHAGGASAVAAGSQRLANFETFKRKHKLNITVKNHASLLEESF